MFVIDSVCLFSSMLKIGIFHAVLQMLSYGQNCKFCYIESSGKNNVASLIKQQSIDFFFYTLSLLYVVFISVKLFKILQNGTHVTIALFDSPCTFATTTHPCLKFNTLQCKQNRTFHMVFIFCPFFFRSKAQIPTQGVVIARLPTTKQK